MVFERKQASAPERAFLLKKSAMQVTGGAKAQQTLKVVKEAIEHQEVKYKQLIEAKDSEIIRQ